MKLCALIMAGGKGTRLEADIEKPLLELNGRFLIDYILEAVRRCEHIDRDRLWSVTSPHTKRTEEYLKGKSVQVLQASGNGYVEDMVFAIERLKLKKTLVVSADLPLLTSEDLDRVIEEYLRHEMPALAVMVPADIVEKSGIHADTVMDGYVPSGVNIVDGKNLNGSEFKMITKESKFAINVNTISDSKVASRRIKHAH
jgi:adenosylcobinamide-phosphate guanylyltransferase